MAADAGDGPLLVVLDRPETWLAEWAVELHGGKLASVGAAALLRGVLQRLQGLPPSLSVCAILDENFISVGRGERELTGVFESVAYTVGGGIVDSSTSVSRVAYSESELADSIRLLVSKTADLRDHIAIFGEEDLEPEQWDLLELTATLSRLLATTDALGEVRRLVNDAE
jgi:hypothetical protein